MCRFGIPSRVVHVPAATLPIHITADGLAKGEANDCPSVLAPPFHLKDPDEIPSSWLPPGPTLATVANQGVNLSISSCNSKFQNK